MVPPLTHVAGADVHLNIHLHCLMLDGV